MRSILGKLLNLTIKIIVWVVLLGLLFLPLAVYGKSDEGGRLLALCLYALYLWLAFETGRIHPPRPSEHFEHSELLVSLWNLASGSSDEGWNARGPNERIRDLWRDRLRLRKLEVERVADFVQFIRLARPYSRTRVFRIIRLHSHKWSSGSQLRPRRRNGQSDK